MLIERDVGGLDQELVSFDLFEPEGSGDQLLVGGGWLDVFLGEPC